MIVYDIHRPPPELPVETTISRSPYTATAADNNNKKLLYFLFLSRPARLNE